MDNKKYFRKKLSDETLKELDDFLNTYPDDEVGYWEWRKAMELYVKVLYELAESIKEYGEAFDKIFKDNDYDNLLTDTSENPALEFKKNYAISKINQELAELQQRVIEPSQELESKISKLEKKYYVN